MSLIFFSPPFFFSLSGYFSQFGAITRLRVSRNKKTAKARSYAFIEFGSPDVAAIAAEAMDG
jgi:nucleolar protein 15